MPEDNWYFGGFDFILESSEDLAGYDSLNLSGQSLLDDDDDDE